MNELRLLTDDSGDERLPIEFRERERIGRCGQVWIDRIPVSEL